MEQNFNHVLLCGQVLTQPQPSHVNHGQSFSRFLLSVPRRILCINRCGSLHL